MKLLIRVARVGLLGIALSSARAQLGGTAWSESWVGSERELYTRALALRGLLSDQGWSIRPFAPSVVEAWSANTRGDPWRVRLSTPADTGRRISVLRPSISSSYNSGFAWGMNDGPVWQGRGLNFWTTAGLAFHAGPFSARVEPMFTYAQNRAFRLGAPPGGSPYVDDMRPQSIDEPQRFGGASLHLVDAGESFVRVDAWGAAAGFSTQELFWGPGVRHALLFDANAAGFPHLFFGTSQPLRTPFGRVHAQLVYGRLEESAYAPTSQSTSRLGAGGIAVWMPPSVPIEIGVARFYHRAWPKEISLADLRIPFGSALRNDELLGVGSPDNQLISAFASFRVPSAGLEVFGEFGKNDRNANSRDLALEPEHNAAWLVGFLDAFGRRNDDAAFWTARLEAASARITPLEQIGRSQSTFYDHATITQGHTELGQILGTPLIDRSGGAELAIDHWNSRGRTGFALLERQMPGDLNVGMPRDSARTQWDVSFSATRFVGRSDLSVVVGNVWDLNRFPDTDVGNAYIRLSFRAAIP